MDLVVQLGGIAKLVLSLGGQSLAQHRKPALLVVDCAKQVLSLLLRGSLAERRPLLRLGN